MRQDKFCYPYSCEVEFASVSLVFFHFFQVGGFEVYRPEIVFFWVGGFEVYGPEIFDLGIVGSFRPSVG